MSMWGQVALSRHSGDYTPGGPIQIIPGVRGRADTPVLKLGQQSPVEGCRFVHSVAEGIVQRVVLTNNRTAWG